MVRPIILLKSLLEKLSLENLLKSSVDKTEKPIPITQAASKVSKATLMMKKKAKKKLRSKNSTSVLLKLDIGNIAATYTKTEGEDFVKLKSRIFITKIL